MRDRIVAIAVLALSAGGLAACKESVNKAEPPRATRRGEQLFRERCAPCHPDGGNRKNPRKTLHAGVLADHGISEPADIVQVMRSPGPGMPSYSEAIIGDEDAKLIAEYVLASFR